MSWDQTYSYTVVLAVDRFAAAVLFGQPDITISSLCWIVLNAGKLRIADEAMEKLRLSKWQVRSLLWIGGRLEHFFPGHCAAARLSDLRTSTRSIDLLGQKT